VSYCQIREGTEMELLESTDIIADTGKALESSHRALIVFNCILRTLDLRQEGQREAYMGHINQTATMLAFR
jgi:hypothetical protein